MKIFLHYYKDLLFYNLIVTFGLTAVFFRKLFFQVADKGISSLTGVMPGPIIMQVLIFSATFGFIGSVYAFKQLHEKEYFFYYNVGFSKKELLTFSFSLNIFLYFSFSTLLYAEGIL
jgi:hypothetical protein